LAGVGAVAAGHDAAGQSCPEGGLLDAAAPMSYVKPTPATCDPSRYLPSDVVRTNGPDPSTWPGPPAYDAGPPSFPGDIYQALGITNPNASTFSYATVQAPYADQAGCLQFDAQGHQAVHDCLCNSCFA